MAIHSIGHGFQTGFRAFKLLLGRSLTRAIFFVGLLILAVLFTLPAIKIINSLIAAFSATPTMSVWSLLAWVPLFLGSGLLLGALTLFWDILIVKSVLKPELAMGELFSQSASAILPGIGYIIVKGLIMLLASPLLALSLGLLAPVINFLIDYLFSFFFVQVIDGNTVFINTDKYKKNLSHNLADFFGLWLFKILFMIIAGLAGTIIGGIALSMLFGFQFSFVEFIRNPLFIGTGIFAGLLIAFAISMVKLAGVTLLYKDEELENVGNNFNNRDTNNNYGNNRDNRDNNNNYRNDRENNNNQRKDM